MSRLDWLNIPIVLHCSSPLFSLFYCVAQWYATIPTQHASFTWLYWQAWRYVCVCIFSLQLFAEHLLWQPDQDNAEQCRRCRYHRTLSGKCVCGPSCPSCACLLLKWGFMDSVLSTACLWEINVDDGILNCWIGNTSRVQCHDRIHRNTVSSINLGKFFIPVIRVQ